MKDSQNGEAFIRKKALYFLARREYAYLELFNKLKNYVNDENSINSVLKELTSLGYLSDERYIKAFVSSKNKKYGIQKLRLELNQKTGDPKLVNQVLSIVENDEFFNAKELWQKKFGTIAKDKVQLAKQVRYLLSKGFSYSTINQILRFETED